jgi:hypothetical protein
MVNLNSQAVVGVDAGIKMGMGPALSSWNKYSLVVNDDGGGGYYPRDFGCPSEGPRNLAVHRQLAG